MIRPALAALGVLAAMGPASAAPLPPFVPVDICGNIASFAWRPAVQKPGIPGASRTLGRTRTFPGGFHVVIERYRGIDPRTAARINALLGFDAGGGKTPDRILLIVPSPDSALLARARSLCIQGFRITGDEGGTWTSYDQLSLDPAIPPR